MQLADHGASFEVERREQVGPAVAQIVRLRRSAWPGRIGSTVPTIPASPARTRA
jgi:hypothetical protein